MSNPTAWNIPEWALLGQLVTFTITGTDLNLEHFRTALKERTLNTDFLRKRLRPSDAFKKACTEVGKIYPNTKTEQRSFLVRQVGHDHGEIHRHIIHERIVHRPGQTRRVEHRTVIKLIYDRGYSDKQGSSAGSVYAEPVVATDLPLTAEEREWLAVMVGGDGARLRERYEHYASHLDSHGLRTYVRDYLRSLDAINLKGQRGSMYFAAQEHAVELTRLAEVVRESESKFWMIPLVDTPEQKEMVVDAFVQEITNEVVTAGKAVGRILEDEYRGITDETYGKHIEVAGRLGDKVERFGKWAHHDMADNKDKVTELLNMTLKLSSHIKDGIANV